MVCRSFFRYLATIALAITFVPCVPGQQRVDPDYDPPVTDPVYAQGAGPRVVFDEFHGRFHSIAPGGTFSPFANVLRKDGYVVDPFFREAFSDSSLEGIDILAIVNADIVFSPQEIAAVEAWVQGGGSLFLVADHMPWPAIANPLGAVFGIEFSNGFAAFRTGEMTFSFSRQPHVGSAGHLADHQLTNGRNVNERVGSVIVFTGSAFQVSGPHEPVMIFGENTVSRLPEEPWRFQSDTPSIPIEGWLQGAVLQVGEGRIAVFGEAAMFSAQIANDGSLMGMNAAPQNLPFLLNVMHWLSGELPDAAGPVPSLTSAGVVNAASFGGSGLIAPGMFVSVFGEELADSVSIASSLPLPADLAGTSVTIGGLPLRLLVVSSGQINGVVPYGLSPGSVAPLVVTRNGVQSVAAEVNVRSAVPGIFTTAQSGQGQGVITRIDPISGEQAIADESNPAAAGEVLVIYGSGLGEVSPAVEAGAAAPSTDPLARVILPVEATIGGVNAPVLFAGLAPGFAGLYQINATVPPGVQPGAAIDVIVTVDGVSSPPVTIAVGG